MTKHFPSGVAALPLFLLPLLSLPTPAAAQAQPPAQSPPADAAPEPPPRETAFTGTFLTVGAGAAISPTYEGSDDYVVRPMGGLMGQIGGIRINPRIGGAALDLIPDSGNKVTFSAGPVARLRFERTGNPRDAAIAALGDRDMAIEVGGTAGIGLNRITNPYDSLSLNVDVRWDVAGAYDGHVISPSLSYLTPLSRGAAVALNISAEHVDDKYAHYYYDVTPRGSIASGLPAYSAKGGWKNATGALIGILDLDGNLANGGFALVGAVSYTRMLGDIRDSPIVSVAGSPDQVIGAVGIAYTF